MTTQTKFILTVKLDDVIVPKGDHSSILRWHCSCRPDLCLYFPKSSSFSFFLVQFFRDPQSNNLLLKNTLTSFLWYLQAPKKNSPGKLQALSSSQLMCCLAGGMHKNEQLAAFGVQLGGLAWEMSWHLQIGRHRLMESLERVLKEIFIAILAAKSCCMLKGQEYWRTVGQRHKAVWVGGFCWAWY